MQDCFHSTIFISRAKPWLLLNIQVGMVPKQETATALHTEKIKEERAELTEGEDEDGGLFLRQPTTLPNTPSSARTEHQSSGSNQYSEFIA